MRGKASAEFLFDAEIERTLHARRRQARQEKLESEEEVVTVHSDSESEEEAMGENPPPPERLLGDYGVVNTPGRRLTIVNQPVNVRNSKLHPSTITQPETKACTRKVKKDPKKCLQRIMTER